jgi:hypothetical protein
VRFFHFGQERRLTSVARIVSHGWATGGGGDSVIKKDAALLPHDLARSRHVSLHMEQDNASRQDHVVPKRLCCVLIKKQGARRPEYFN